MVDDLTGLKFGKRTVLRRVENNSRGASMWECQCQCGKITVLEGSTIRANRNLSCKKCIDRNAANNKARKKRKRTFDPLMFYEIDGVKKQTKLYTAWKQMKYRCNPKNKKDRKNYYDRGIKVCEQWSRDYHSFYDYVSSLPHCGEEGRSLDRIDNEKGYEPGNVRWATIIEQNNNKRASSKK